MALILRFLIILILYAVASNSNISTNFNRLCADAECKVPVSKAKTTLKYTPVDDVRVAFRRGVTVTVYSKAAHPDGNLWGIEVNGKRGYASKKFLQEIKVLVHPSYNVTMQEEVASYGGKMDSNLISADTTVSPDPVKNTDSFNLPTVIDGTSLDLNRDDIYINPTEATAHISHIQTTSVPDVPASKVVNEPKPLQSPIPGAANSESVNESSLGEGQGSEEEDGDEEEEDEEDEEDQAGEEEEEEEEAEEEEQQASKSTSELKTQNDIGSESIASGEVKPDVNVLSSSANTLVDSEQKQASTSDGGGGDGDVASGSANITTPVDEGSAAMPDHQPTTKSASGIGDSTPQVMGSSDVLRTSSEMDIDVSTENNADEQDSPGEEKIITQSAQVENGKEEEEILSGVQEHGTEILQKREAVDEMSVSDKIVEKREAHIEQIHTDISGLPENMLGVNEVLKSSLVNEQEQEESVIDETSHETSSLFDNSSHRDTTLEPSLTSLPESTESNLLMEDRKEDTPAAEDSQVSDSQISQPKVHVPSEPDTMDFQYSNTLNQEERENSQMLQDELPDGSSTEYEGVTNIIASGFTYLLNTYSGVFQSKSSEHISETNAQEEKSDTVLEERQNADPDADIVSDESGAYCGGLTRCELGIGEPPTDFVQDWSKACGQLQAEGGDPTADIHRMSYDTFIYLFITAVTVLLFSLGHYYIEKQRHGGSLISKINSLEKALMVVSQEKFALKDELENTKEKVKTFQDSCVPSGSSVSVKTELEECKVARAELEEQVASLEKELEAATEAGLELNRMMSELLSSQHDSDTLMKSVEHLQNQLDCQKDTINSMNESLNAKNIENENLKSELTSCSSTIHDLEEELQKANKRVTELEDEKVQVEHEYQQRNKSIEEKLLGALENKTADTERLSKELNALQDVLNGTHRMLAAREGEVKVLQEYVGQMESQNKEDGQIVSMESLLDFGRQNAELQLICQERDEIKEKFLGEENARKLLEDHVRIVSEEVSTLRIKYQDADRERTEAQTRLEVLSNYFKEKETQLHKELGLQEAMSIQRQGDALSSFEQIKAFEEEIENYKSQNELLKKEILDQERSMKAQMNSLEKKAHENWVAARQAERCLEENKQEASQLRNKLTLIERNASRPVPGTDANKPTDRSKVNGDIMASPARLSETQELTSSPLHYLPATPPLIPPAGQPLPPTPFPGMPLGMFLPPNVGPGVPFPMPPPPFPDLRPPPLGRMSSPPPDSRGTFSPFEHSPPMSPPNHPYRSLPYEDSPSQFHQTPPTSSPRTFGAPYAGKWDDRSGNPRSSFRPVPRDSPREGKGSAMSSGHSSDSLDKTSRYNSRV